MIFFNYLCKFFIIYVVVNIMMESMLQDWLHYILNFEFKASRLLHFSLASTKFHLLLA